MTITRDSTLPEVALAVGAQLTRRRIRATLTGGACVAIYTGTYSSKDADFIVEGRVRQRDLDDALAEVGFERRGAQYVHPETDFYVEFPPGPLSIGEDLAIRPVQLAVVGDAAAFGLSPTDCCRDRLAAYYHWDDRQALRLAVEVARRHAVHFETIEAWSDGEGMRQKYAEFLRALKAERRRSQGGRARPRVAADATAEPLGRSRGQRAAGSPSR